MNWKIDPVALDKARDILGIEYPVRIRKASGQAAGKYHGLGLRGPTTEEPLSEPAHHITISPMVSDKMVNEVVWHEMTHAAQCEDYLPEDDGPDSYKVANARLRRAFGREMRAIRAERGITTRAMTADYGDVSFEEEARDFMDHAKKISIVVVDDDKPEVDPEDSFKGFDHKYRVDIFDADDKYVGTHYVYSNDEFSARRFARDTYMDGKWSSNLSAIRIASKGGVA